MVTRKPVNPSADIINQVPKSPTAPSASGLPYPTTPPTHSTGQASSAQPHDATEFDLIDMDEHRKATRRDSDVSSHGTWDSNESEDEEEPEGFIEVPKPLQIRPSQQNLIEKKENHNATLDELPAILRPGPTGGSTADSSLPQRRSQEMQRYDEEAQENPWKLEETHPQLGQGVFSENTSTIGQNAEKLNESVVEMPPAPARHPQNPIHYPSAPSNPPPAPPTSAPPPPPSLPSAAVPNQPPTDGMSKLSIAGKASAEAVPSFQTAEVLPVPQQGQPPFPPVTSTTSAETPIFPSNNPWRTQSPLDNQQEGYFPPPPGPPPEKPTTSATSQSAQYKPPPGPPPGRSGILIGHEEPPSSQSPPTQPPLPVSSTTQTPQRRQSDNIPETPRTRAIRQRSEHYQIKHVNWYDKTAMRRSPILTQNANGPCPLLALVNALVLSTPPSLNTALMETLRTREQVSLGLLLDAVFDELMSGRRGDTAHGLPDVSELYSFLLALHTGMNVNPRFVNKGASTSAPSSAFHSGMGGALSSYDGPGDFEETKEMQLYSTFSIPLIHGWIPGHTSPAYSAFVNSAQTFEDAQNIQFVGLELEDKSWNEGLSVEEQKSLHDINTIKQFLSNWPTQLTEHGLDMISRSMAPGEIAILFRNDHFSTLYKEPKHGALMTLVTDAGYSSHDEIVWESLVDVNGAASEMFSGDFRVVSHSEEARLNQGNSAGGEQGWQTVESRNRYHRRQQSNTPSILEEAPPLPGPRPTNRPGMAEPIRDGSNARLTAAEQEDHDLALALQLQEEEEDRHREATARRRREQELSEQFLENEERPPVPPRRSRGTSDNASGGSNSRPAGRAGVSRPTDSADPDAPPSYEQAASDQPYRPAGSTAPATQGNPLNAYDALRRQQSAYAAQSSTTLNDLAPPYTAGASSGGRRRPSGAETNRIRRRSSGMGSVAMAPGRTPGAAGVKDVEDDRCIIM